MTLNQAKKDQVIEAIAAAKAVTVRLQAMKKLSYQDNVETWNAFRSSLQFDVSNLNIRTSTI